MMGSFGGEGGTDELLLEDHLRKRMKEMAASSKYMRGEGWKGIEKVS